MKKIFFTFLLLCAALSAKSQKVFTVLYATSDDGFVNVRTAPNASAQKVGEIHEFMHGTGDGVLLSRGKWHKVKTSNGRVGYANSRYLGEINWMHGSQRTLVAKGATPIYYESFADDGRPLTVFTTVPAGTLIANEYVDNGNYYYLQTAHDGYLVKKSSVILR